MTSHLISDDSGELIIEQEVSSEAIYAKRYQHPERPGGQSGITIGIGYDCGYSSADQIRKDWGGRIPPDMVEMLATRCAGLKAENAQARLAEVKPKVVVPWAAAISEFYDVEVPRWLAKCRAVLPNLDMLPPDCIGALVSLAYNRGPSFTIPASKDSTGRYVEMRAIRTHMVAKEFAKIPGEFRKMKRLWTAPSVRGLVARREEEAKLFERGLAAMPEPVAALEPEPAEEADQIDARMPDSGDDRHAVAPAPDDDAADDAAEDATAAAAPAIDPATEGDPELFSIQKRLKAMHYNPGLLDGKWGGGTSGAISAFINDRGGHIAVPASMDAFNDVRDELKAEIQRAETERFTRPVTEARKVADPKTVAAVAPESVPVRRNFLATTWAAIVAFFTAIVNSISGYISQFWDFLSDHKDDLSDHPGMLSTVWGYVGKVPTSVWILLVAGGFAFLAISARSGLNKIKESVQSGARQ